jgi:hypothetical protein
MPRATNARNRSNLLALTPSGLVKAPSPSAASTAPNRARLRQWSTFGRAPRGSCQRRASSGQTTGAQPPLGAARQPAARRKHLPGNVRTCRAWRRPFRRSECVDSRLLRSPRRGVPPPEDVASDQRRSNPAGMTPSPVNDRSTLPPAPCVRTQAADFCRTTSTVGDPSTAVAVWTPPAMTKVIPGPARAHATRRCDAPGRTRVWV